MASTFWRFIEMWHWTGACGLVSVSPDEGSIGKYTGSFNITEHQAYGPKQGPLAIQSVEEADTPVIQGFPLFPRSPTIHLFQKLRMRETHPLSVPQVPMQKAGEARGLCPQSLEAPGAKALDLELKHVRLLLGQLGHLLPDGLHQGRRGDVGQGGIGRVVLCQALLRGRRGGHGALLQAGVHAGRLAVLPREPGRGVLLVTGPGVSLDVPWEGDLQRMPGDRGGAWD